MLSVWKLTLDKGGPMKVLSFLPQNIHWFLNIELKKNLKP